MSEGEQPPYISLLDQVRFLAPAFADAGDAKVTLSLNGQEHEQATELLFRYQSPSVPCTLQ